jgi:hypothetical protein
MKKSKFLMHLLLTIVFVGTACSGNDNDPSDKEASVKLANSEDFGTYLVDANGKTLYFFGYEL